jgi:signal peptidase I
MNPTLIQWDFIIANKLTDTFHRWDIIVHIPDWKKFSFIQKVIGVWWDNITIDNNQVTVCNSNECEVLQESYLWEWVQTNTDVCWGNEFTVPLWEYFVLWDNREFSTDSRCCFWLWCYEWSYPYVKKENIIWDLLIKLNEIKYFADLIEQYTP